MKKELNSDQIRLSHIIAAIENIEDFVNGFDQETFLTDKRVQSAVMSQFLIIGEAAAALSLELTSQNIYPWHKPRAFRNNLAFFA